LRRHPLLCKIRHVHTLRVLKGRVYEHWGLCDLGVQYHRWHPFKTVHSTLNCSGNPGVKWRTSQGRHRSDGSLPAVRGRGPTRAGCGALALPPGCAAGTPLHTALHCFVHTSSCKTHTVDMRRILQEGMSGYIFRQPSLSEYARCAHAVPHREGRVRVYL
jgi:hypothetical protein